MSRLYPGKFRGKVEVNSKSKCLARESSILSAFVWVGWDSYFHVRIVVSDKGVYLIYNECFWNRFCWKRASFVDKSEHILFFIYFIDSSFVT